MPWTRSNYPASMKNLPAQVRYKAIEIANALLDEKNMREGIVIATAISRAKDWDANRGKKTKLKSRDSRSSDVKKHGEDRYVIPYHDHEWAIRKEGAKKVTRVFSNKREAVKAARSQARQAQASLTIQKRTGQVQERISYNPHNTGR